MQCCYCRRPLLFGEMQIDHIIPEAVLDNPLRLAEAKAELSLLSTFDGQGLDNLVPACGPCNRTKSGTPFDGLASLLPLRRAGSKKADIERRLRSLQREARKTELEVLIELRRRFDDPNADC